MKKRLLNPRGYLSHSQIELWERSPKQYIEQYVYGAAGFQNNRMRFGSKVAAALENGEDTDDETINMLRMVLPKYDLSEFEIRTTFESPGGLVDLLGKPDTMRSTDFAFREYKTGTTRWTQARADRSNQLNHYAAIIWVKHNLFPASVHLDWAQTEVSEGEVQLTGEVTSFEVQKTTGDLLKYLALVSRVAREIDEAYRAEMQKLA